MSPSFLVCVIWSNYWKPKGYVIVTEFDELLTNLKTLLSFIKQLKPSFTIILGDFNAKSNNGGQMT